MTYPPARGLGGYKNIEYKNIEYSVKGRNDGRETFKIVGEEAIAEQLHD